MNKLNLQSGDDSIVYFADIEVATDAVRVTVVDIAVVADMACASGTTVVKRTKPPDAVAIIIGVRIHICTRGTAVITGSHTTHSVSAVAR